MSGGGGGGGWDPGPQYEYDKEKVKFDYSVAQDNYAYQQDAYEMQLWNRNQQLDFQDQQRQDEWNHMENMRTYDWNNQVAARIASEKAVGKQLYFNEIAEEIQINDATRQLDERLTSAAFKHENLVLGLAQSTEKAGLKNQAEALSSRELGIKQVGKKVEFSKQAQELGISSLQAAGQAAAMGQSGRTARKTMQAALATIGQKQAILADVVENSASEYALAFEKSALSYDEIATDIVHKEQEVELAGRELKESMKSAGDQHLADVQKAALDKYGADLAAEDRLAPEPSLPPGTKPPLNLPRPKTMAPMKPPSWDRIPKPVKGSMSSGGGAAAMLSTAAAGVGLVAGIMTIGKALSAGSDDRLKYDITRVGTSPSGIPKYTFKYRADGKHGPKYIGTSAQDLLAMGREDAVGQKEKDGFYYVDYSKLDVDMEVVTT